MGDARERMEIQEPGEVMLVQVYDERGEEIMRITPDGEMVIADGVTPRDVAERLMDAWGDLVADALRDSEDREVMAWMHKWEWPDAPNTVSYDQWEADDDTPGLVSKTPLVRWTEADD